MAITSTSLLSADQYYQQPQYSYGSCPGGNCPYNQGAYQQGSYNQGAPVYYQNPNTQGHYYQGPTTHGNAPAYRTEVYTETPNIQRFDTTTPPTYREINTNQGVQYNQPRPDQNNFRNQSNIENRNLPQDGRPANRMNDGRMEPNRTSSWNTNPSWDNQPSWNKDSAWENTNKSWNSQSSWDNKSSWNSQPSWDKTNNDSTWSANEPDYSPSGTRNAFSTPNGQRTGTYNNVQRQEQKAFHDQDIAKEVHNVLSGWFTTNYPNVTFDVNNGVVSLSGTVDTAEDKAKIERDIRKIEGVREVQNNITVPSQKTAMNYYKSSVAANTGEKVMNKTDKRYSQDFAATETDRKINSKIRDRLANKWFSKSFDTVIIRTTNGVVVITGTVDTNEDVNNISDEIKRVEGVKSVNNQLSTKR